MFKLLSFVKAVFWLKLIASLVQISKHFNKYYIYTAKNRSAEYEETAGINLRAIFEFSLNSV